MDSERELMCLSFRQVKLKGAVILGLSFVFDVSIPLFSPFDWENTLWSYLWGFRGT